MHTVSRKWPCLLALVLALLPAMCHAGDGALRVLAFGDSLTEGLTEKNTKFHPYAIKLQELLQAHNANFRVVQKGVSGERVLLTMVQRLEAELKKAEAEGSRYSWVLLLAGINDIGNGSGAQHVFRGLMSMFEASTKHGARVLAMTCLENFGTGATAWDTQRAHLNVLIREYCMKYGGPSGAVLVDLDKLIPFKSLSEAEKNATFDDGLHLTAKGYDRMAEVIFEKLKPAL